MDWTTFAISWVALGLIGGIILSEYDTIRRYKSELYDRRNERSTTIWSGRPTPLHEALLWSCCLGWIFFAFGLFIGIYTYPDYKYNKQYIKDYYGD